LLSEMEILAQDLVIIAAGQLVRQGTVDQIVGSMDHMGSVRVRTPKPEALTAALTERGGQVGPGEHGALAVHGMDAAAVGAAAFAAGVELHELVNERPDLENVFLSLTHDKAGIR
ncbi:MAG TPA: ABC transporter ATP-binding protein, partial [Rugosimonospora sp.]|nr:ABC transporter ATP-binding protein [Rugosimonospora sp.]